MFIEKLKEEKLRKRWEGIRDDLRKVIASGELPNTPFFEAVIAAGTPVTYAVPVSEAKIIQVDEAIEGQSLAVPYEILEHFVKLASHRFIKHFCICREAMACKDYPIDMGCLFLGETAKDINPELGHLVSVEEALEYIKRLKEAGFIFNTGYVPGDSVMLDVGPSNRLMTICACCPCCCITKVVKPQKPGERRLPGVEVHVTDSCIDCGECLEACIYGFIQIEEGKAVIDPCCVTCGRCVDACPENAIEVRISDPSYIEKAIEKLSQAVEVT